MGGFPSASRRRLCSLSPDAAASAPFLAPPLSPQVKTWDAVIGEEEMGRNDGTRSLTKSLARERASTSMNSTALTTGPESGYMKKKAERVPKKKVCKLQAITTTRGRRRDRNGLDFSHNKMC